MARPFVAPPPKEAARPTAAAGPAIVPPTARQLLTAKYAQGTQLPLLNASGASVAKGSVVVLDTSVTDDAAFTTSTTEDSDDVFGVTLEDIPDSVRGNVQIAGIVEQVRVAAGTARYQYLRQSTSAGVGEGTASPTRGTFAQAITSRDAAGYVRAVLGRYPLTGAPTGGLSVYGDGSDGDVTISVDTSLSTNKTYNNLTIAAGVSLNANGYGVWVNDTLTFGDASSRIHNNGGDGGNGADGNGNLGGAAGTTAAAAGSGTLGAPPAPVGSGTGANAGGGSPGNGTAGNNATNSIGGAAGVAGAAGGAAGGGAAGGTAGSGGTRTATTSVFRALVPLTTFRLFLADGTLAIPQAGGGSGGSGGGGASNRGADGTQNGGGGGGGAPGAPGGNLLVVARRVAGAGNLQANGGDGGDGGNGAAAPGGGEDGGGGGGAGSGGPGGIAILITQDTTLWTGDATADGGAAGTPGAGGAAGMGSSGSNGSSGNAGAAGVALGIPDWG